MSDVPETPNPAAQADTGEALARLASYGESRKRAKDARGWGPLVLVLVVLLPLAAVAVVVWLQMGMRAELDALRADNAALRQQSTGSTNQVAQLQQSQQEFGATLQRELQQTLQRELATANSAIAAQAQGLAAFERGLADLRATATEAVDSPLSEAETLLRFAQQRLVLARDVDVAIDLYLAADEALAAVDTSQVFSARDALARELAELRALPLVDVAGLFAQLSAQAARVDAFAVTSAAAQSGGLAQAEPAVTGADWWSSVQQTIGEYFVVTRSTDALLPQLNDEEQFLIRALIQLRIEQGKTALLRAEPQLYRRALDDALAISRQWFGGAESNAGGFLAALESLRDTPIVVDIPALGDALSAVRQLSGAARIAPPLKPADPTPLPDAIEPAAPGTQL